MTAAISIDEVSTLPDVICVAENIEELEKKTEQLILSAVLSAEDMDDHFLAYMLTMALEHLAQSRYQKSN
jgi:hypothetical protein